jgi:hypothetical protein
MEALLAALAPRSPRVRVWALAAVVTIALLGVAMGADDQSGPRRLQPLEQRADTASAEQK